MARVAREQLPQWVVTNFNTFVCTACSGIHREFSHRVKSISLASFTEEEVEGVRRGGNLVNNDLYMAKCVVHLAPLPPRIPRVPCRR